MQSSTIRSSLDATIGESIGDEASVIRADAILAQWARTGRADMVAVLREHPSVLRDRSLVLELAIEEYKAHCHASGELNLEKHCGRFVEFGSSIQRSIMRQLEVQRYIDARPDLIEELCAPKWPRVNEYLGGF